MKLCSDCKFYRKNERHEDTGAFDLCVHPKVAKPDLVRGDQARRYCDLTRQSYGLFGPDKGYCGKRARYWEPADSKPAE